MAWIKVKAKNRSGEDYMKIVWQNEEPAAPVAGTLNIAPVTITSAAPVAGEKTSKKAKK